MCGMLVGLSLLCPCFTPTAYSDTPLATYDNLWVAVGPLSIATDEAVQSLVVIGPVTIAGNVFGDVISVGGKITVKPGALVSGQVTAVCAPVEVGEGARVLGGVREQELPLVRETPLTPGRPSTAKLILGDHEFTEPELSQAVVIGGNALVRANSGLTEIIVIGGDLSLEVGSHVKAARVFGGTLTRAIPAEGDERAEPCLLRVSGRLAAEHAALALLASRFERSEDSLKLAASSDSTSTGEVHLAAFAPASRVELTLAAKEANRSPLPAGCHLDTAARFGDGWASWPRTTLWVATDADPLFQTAAAAAANLRLDVTVGAGDGPQPNESTRSITLAVPADARDLLNALDAR